MIVKAGASLRGSRVRGLLTYLLGPGRHTEHVDPRVVGAWTPVEFLPGHDETFNGLLASLSRALEAPVRAVAPHFRPAKHVGHCIVQTDRRVDPVLTDEEWASIAAELVDAAGLTDHRWVAVRHDEHGIHIAATLVDEHGNRARLRHEIRNLNRCRVQLEARYCRRRTDPGTRTGGVSYQRFEAEKMGRAGATRPVRLRRRSFLRRRRRRSCVSCWPNRCQRTIVGRIECSTCSSFLR